MSEQVKQQIEVKEGNLSTAEAENDSDDYDFVRLDQTTPYNDNALVLQLQRQNGNGTIWNPLGPAFSVDMNELNLKMAALEAKNELLEGRLEKMELKGKIRELQQEAIGHKLKEAEAKAEMANNQLKSTIQAMQQEMANFELLAKEFKAKNNVKVFYNLVGPNIGQKTTLS